MCAEGEVWQLAVAVAALAAGMLAFILLKQGSGVREDARSSCLSDLVCLIAKLLLILECIIALSLMLAGVGASYLVDFVIFFVLLQLVEVRMKLLCVLVFCVLKTRLTQAAANYNNSSSSDGHDDESQIVSLTGMAKHIIFFVQVRIANL